MMTMGKFEKLLIAVFLLAAVLFARSMFAGEPYQGNISEPIQTTLTNPIKTTIEGADGDVQLSLLAQYIVEGVVKSKEMYLLDYPSKISRFDVALAWGTLNRKNIDEHIRYSQGGRWYCYRYSGDIPVEQEYISSHSANIHLIAKDGDILRKIIFLGRNDHIILKGFLVNVDFKEGLWKTSLTRQDTGNGACEIMYVTSVQIID